MAAPKEWPTMIASLFHQLHDGTGLAVRMGVGRPAPLGIAVTWSIDEEHFGTALQCRSEGMQLVEKIAARSMYEDDGGKICCRTRPNVDAIHMKTADVDQFAPIRESRRDPACLVEAVGDCQGEGEEDQKCRKHQASV
jgi:hypothetical protein